MLVGFRSPYVVYLLVTGMARWRPRTRFVALGMITCYFLWYGMWNTFTFIAGLLLAELKTSEKGSQKVLNLAIFSLGAYLLCLSDEEVIPFGYNFLTPLQPYHWHNLDEFNINWSSNISWMAIGAVLTIYSISNSSSPSSSSEGYSFLQSRLSTL